MTKRYLLVKDITIPAGTIFNQDAINSPNGFKALFGLTETFAGSISYTINPDKQELRLWFKELPEKLNEVINGENP